MPSHKFSLKPAIKLTFRAKIGEGKHRRKLDKSAPNPCKILRKVRTLKPKKFQSKREKARQQSLPLKNCKYCESAKFSHTQAAKLGTLMLFKFFYPNYPKIIESQIKPSQIPNFPFPIEGRIYPFKSARLKFPLLRPIKNGLRILSKAVKNKFTLIWHSGRHKSSLVRPNRLPRAGQLCRGRRI